MQTWGLSASSKVRSPRFSTRNFFRYYIRQTTITFHQFTHGAEMKSLMKEIMAFQNINIAGLDTPNMAVMMAPALEPDITFGNKSCSLRLCIHQYETDPASNHRKTSGLAGHRRADNAENIRFFLPYWDSYSLLTQYRLSLGWLLRHNLQ